MGNLIELMDIMKLKNHSLNAQIYGDTEPNDDLLESIRNNGILEPIVVTQEGTILSGHRRFRAAKSLGLNFVPVRTIEVNSELDEQETILEFNRQREKTFSQKMREADKLKEIVAMRAKEKQRQQGEFGKFGGKRSSEAVEDASNHEQTLGPTLVQGFAPEEKKRDNEARTSTVLAAHVGMKRVSFEKAQKIFQHAQNGDEKARELVKKLDAGTTTVNAAYSEVVVNEQKKAAIENIITKAQEPEGLYNVVVIDPPWPYEYRTGDPLHRGKCPYPTMSIDQIQAISIPADDDCILFLWTTNAFIHDAFHVLSAWGFTYKTILTWVKDHIGLGNWLRGQTEHCLLSIKGKPPVSLSSQPNVLHAANREHSRKPREFYDLVDSLCHGRKLDMFSREKRDGWHQHGAESNMF
jgi:N6-adenosine-specific RNA methylase IME4